MTGIGRITPSGEIIEISVPAVPDPVGITAGPDGNVWFTDGDGSVGRVTPQGAVTSFPTPNSSPNSIAAGPDGNLWFTEVDGNRIGRLEIGGEGHLGLSFTPTSGKPGTLFKSTYTCSSGTPMMTVANDHLAATATSDIDVHLPVTGTSGTYTQPRSTESVMRW
jgi:hypothetical protein